MPGEKKKKKDINIYTSHTVLNTILFQVNKNKEKRFFQEAAS